MKKTTIPECKLIGIQLESKTTNKNGQSSIDCGQLWQRFEEESVFSKIPNKISDEVYAVYYNYDGSYMDPFDYFIGCRVEVDTKIPAGLRGLQIPGGQYQVVTAKGKIPDSIGAAWHSIWEDNTLNRVYTFDFEVYGEKSKNGSEAEVNIYLAVN